MVNSGCKVCVELMKKSMQATRAHLDASFGHEHVAIGADTRQIEQLREAKLRAMDEYNDHMLTHRDATPKAMRAGEQH